MNVSVIGYYGNNFGDLLMLKSLLSVQQPGVVYTVLTYGHGDALKKQGFISGNNIAVVELNRENRLLAYKSIINSSAIIWGGGTCFMDEGGTGGIKYMTLARLFGASVIYAGIGVDNHKKLKTRLILFFATVIAKAIYIRDSASLQAVRKINPWIISGKIKQSVDLAYALNTTDIHSVADLEDGGDYILLCLRDLEDYGSQSSGDICNRLLDLSIRICWQLGVNKVGIFNADAEVDTNVSRYAESELADRGFKVFKISGSDIEESMAYIKGARHILSVRLHPAVVAYSLGTPFSLYNYSDKNKKFTAETQTESCLIHQDAIDEFIPDYTAGFTSGESAQKNLALSAIKEIYQLLN